MLGFRAIESPNQTVSREHVVFDVSSQQETNAKRPTMSFKEWKNSNYEAQPGMVITNVPVSELFTTQEVLDANKMVHAYEAQEENKPDAFTVSGIPYQHPKPHMGIVPVIGDGHHRAVLAAVNGQRVNLQIVNAAIPEGTGVWRVNNLVRRYGGLVR